MVRRPVTKVSFSFGIGVGPQRNCADRQFALALRRGADQARHRCVSKRPVCRTVGRMR